MNTESYIGIFERDLVHGNYNGSILSVSAFLLSLLIPYRLHLSASPELIVSVQLLIILLLMFDGLLFFICSCDAFNNCLIKNQGINLLLRQQDDFHLQFRTYKEFLNFGLVITK